MSEVNPSSPGVPSWYSASQPKRVVGAQGSPDYDPKEWLKKHILELNELLKKIKAAYAAAKDKAKFQEDMHKSVKDGGNGYCAEINDLGMKLQGDMNGLEAEKPRRITGDDCKWYRSHINTCVNAVNGKSGMADKDGKFDEAFEKADISQTMMLLDLDDKIK